MFAYGAREAVTGFLEQFRLPELLPDLGGGSGAGRTVGDAVRPEPCTSRARFGANRRDDIERRDFSIIASCRCPTLNGARPL